MMNSRPLPHGTTRRLLAITLSLAAATAALLSGPGTAAATLEEKYPEASAAFELLEQHPMLKDALLDDGFFEALERRTRPEAHEQLERYVERRDYHGFARIAHGRPEGRQELERRLEDRDYRRIGSHVPLRIRTVPETILERPGIMLDFQTEFENIWHLETGGRDPGSLIYRGGRDAMPHRTFYGATDDPEAHAGLRAFYDRWRRMAPDQRFQPDPEFAALVEEYLPSGDLEAIRSEIVEILTELAEAFGPYGGTVLDEPQHGHFGVRITPDLHVYIRDFPARLPDQASGINTGLRFYHDEFFWVHISGGPREAPTGFLPAFPGAEGLGAMATGGRGGKHIYVTNVNTEGPGSLAEAVKTPGPRIVQFAVSGTIRYPEGEGLLISEPDLTLIGHTAPGEGVMIDGHLFMAASNVIMRGMRFRLYPPNHDNGMQTFGDLENIIFDHCSFAYGSDELIRFIGAGATFWNYTFQHCVLGPGLAGIGDHPFGPEIGGVGTMHHNIFHNTQSRSPEADGMLIDFRNNIKYNVRSGHARRPHTRFNYVDNYIIEKLDNPYNFSFSTSTNVYAAGNLWESDGRVVPFERGIHQSDYLPGPYPAVPVRTARAPDELEEFLVPIAGAFLPARDSTDRHFLQAMQSRSGKLPYWINPEGDDWQRGRRGPFNLEEYEPWDPASFPGPAPGAQPHQDTSGNGIPDGWLTQYGLDIDDPEVANHDLNGSGYTNLEEYINGTDPTAEVDYTEPENNIHSLHQPVQAANRP
jgi:pectate lyase